MLSPHPKIIRLYAIVFLKAGEMIEVLEVDF
jgi:hypothetical protein